MVKPTNKIVQKGDPLVRSVKVETVANVYPGRLLKQDTAEGQVEVAGANQAMPTGWAGYEQGGILSGGAVKPLTIDTIYTVNDIIAELYGGGFVLVASLAANQSITRGQLLSPAASGQLKSVSTTDGVTQAVARSCETKSSSASARDLLVLSLI